VCCHLRDQEPFERHARDCCRIVDSSCDVRGAGAGFHQPPHRPPDGLHLHRLRDRGRRHGHAHRHRRVPRWADQLARGRAAAGRLPRDFGQRLLHNDVRGLIRSRSGAVLGALSVSTVTTGVMFIAVPLELRSLHAGPREIGVTLAMFGLGTFLFEWVWGVIADRVGYQWPLVISMVLYAGGVFLLARSNTVPFIAASYLLTSGMLVSVGPVGRSFLGTTLPPNLRATGLAVLSAEWLFGDAIGAGLGGYLLEHISTRDVLYAASVLPLISAGLLLLVFRG